MRLNAEGGVEERQREQREAEKDTNDPLDSPPHFALSPLSLSLSVPTPGLHLATSYGKECNSVRVYIVLRCLMPLWPADVRQSPQRGGSVENQQRAEHVLRPDPTLLVSTVPSLSHMAAAATTTARPHPHSPMLSRSYPAGACGHVHVFLRFQPLSLLTSAFIAQLTTTLALTLALTMTLTPSSC